MAEGVAADAEEALIARKEARAKMKFEKQFRKIRQGGAGAAGAAGLMAFRARKLKVATSQPAGGGASLNTPRSRSASPNADALEATLFPQPPAKAHGETQAEQQMQDADNLSAAGIADSLYMTPEQEAASQAAGVTPALVPTPPPPRE
eukprot:COSAG02_NODE_7536_length_2970_cov_1.384535_2_plen_148_part_00